MRSPLTVLQNLRLRSPTSRRFEQSGAGEHTIEYLRIRIVDRYQRKPQLRRIEQTQPEHHVFERNGVGIDKDRLVKFKEFDMDVAGSFEVDVLNRSIERCNALRR